MSWRGISLSVLAIFVVLCSAKIANAHASMNLRNSNSSSSDSDTDTDTDTHQNYTQFLLTNGVARTPPMGYWNIF